jgi:hypothetical protein
MVPLQVADELAFESAKNVKAFIEQRGDRTPIKRMKEAKILLRSDYLERQGMEEHIAAIAQRMESD